MRVFIRSVSRIDQRLFVEVDTPCGPCRGGWFGDAPEIGTEHDVEWTLDEAFLWGGNIRVNSKGTPSPSIEVLRDNSFRICGVLEQLDDDGVAQIRLGDGLVMVETIGEPPPGEVPVTLDVKYIDIYPTNI
jgi:hypothetical protein